MEKLCLITIKIILKFSFLFFLQRSATEKLDFFTAYKFDLHDECPLSAILNKRSLVNNYLVTQFILLRQQSIKRVFRNLKFNECLCFMGEN